MASFLNVKVKGLDDAAAYLAGLSGKRFPDSMAWAMNTVAFNVREAGQKMMRDVFDKPTPWTVKSWYVSKKATREDLTVGVGLSDFLSNKNAQGPDFLLGQHWYGGERNLKPYEQRLRAIGALPSGMIVVPGKAAFDLGMIDQYGNFKTGPLMVILSKLQVFNRSGENSNASGRKRRGAAAAARSGVVYWAGKPGPNTPPGIWRLDEKFKHGRGRLRPVMVFVRAGSYRKRFDANKLGQFITKRDFPRLFDLAMQRSARTSV